MDTNFDFSGWATKNNLKCSDGRVIGHNAFKDNDGMTVPLVWSHQHNDPSNVIGHALLENRDEGVYTYCYFNNTEKGNTSKQLVQHGDVKALSIYANGLKQDGSVVLHGAIKEVSLVLAGANPGALIDTVMRHGELCDDEAVITTDESITIAHAEEQKEEKPVEKEKTIADIIDTMNEEQKQVLEFLVGSALEEQPEGEGNDTEEEGDNEMKHNAFDCETEENTLMHDGLNIIMADAKRYGSLKESYLAHAQEYGIENLDYVNTEDKNYYDRPEFIRRNPTSWISVVMNGVHHTPFDKVRVIFADITEDEARAKGYIKGKYKKEEVFKLLKRSVSATTIYKKQKFDRDDLIEADFDIVPWVKGEMETMLEEEKARAYLWGDGRSSADEDKIDESRIIPVVKDEDLFSIKVTVTPGTDESTEHAIITAAVLAQDDYQGSGNTVAFMEAKQVSKMLIMEDKFGHRLYNGLTDLAGAMGVGSVVKVPSVVMPTDVYGVIVDLSDYNVGQKNMGNKNMFDDFDIDYNQQKYLIEERQSAALVRPYSAIVLKKAQ